jgi:tRNA nucleotidyltransferase/poly(A) polymerase
MVEDVRAALAGAEAWIVGGAIRDELLGRPVVDLDVACAEPAAASRAFARRTGGARFALSERHGAWRVALDDERTVDFTPLRDGIAADLATRDFTINAIARPLAGGSDLDPFGGRDDVASTTLRAVSSTVFVDDPLRLLRAVRLEDELGFALDPVTKRLVREHAALVARPAGERILAELRRLSRSGFRRLDELGLLAPLGGTSARLGRASRFGGNDFLLVVALGEALERYPISNELRRYARTLLRAEPPPDDSPRSLHRFRRATEPWALDAAAFLGAPDQQRIVEARLRDPGPPLLRGDELGVEPGPEVGRLLELIEEERAAGTVTTREDALELVRSRRGS